MASPNPSRCKVVLITGCSSGIGKAAADRLARAGHVVIATARREESVAELARWATNHAGHAHARRLDVTDGATIEPVVRETLETQGRIDCLINNAGYGQLGAVEDVSLDLWRRQMETNLLGVVAVTQAVLPAMREQRNGRIVNVSSVVAHVTMPLMGAYCASKHALEAFSNALRMEAASFGVDVVLIEPGPIKTQFRPNIEAGLARDPVHAKSHYEWMYEYVERYWEKEYRRAGKSAEEVAVLIQKAVESRKPKTRYKITSVAKLIPRLIPFIPDRLLDRTILHQLRGKRGTR